MRSWFGPTTLMVLLVLVALNATVLCWATVTQATPARSARSARSAVVSPREPHAVAERQGLAASAVVRAKAPPSSKAARHPRRRVVGPAPVVTADLLSRGLGS